MTNAFEMMIDTVGSSAGNIPSNAVKVAGYVTGSGGVEWTASQFARFEKTAGVVRICQNSHGDPTQANAFDIEPGALSIDDFVRMAGIRQNHYHWNSCAYIEASQLGDLVQACEAKDLSMVQLWVANWSLDEQQAIGLLGTLVRKYQIVAVQYASPASNPHTICPGSNRTLKELNLDLSVTMPGWFPPPKAPAPPAPVPPPAPKALTATLELTIDGHQGSLSITSSDNGKTWRLA